MNKSETNINTYMYIFTMYLYNNVNFSFKRKMKWFVRLIGFKRQYFLNGGKEHVQQKIPKK